MPRQARSKSQSNIYHVMLRGINRQNIFEDDQDRHFFLSTLKNCKERSGFRLHCFCLMANHVHLLMEQDQEPLDLIFRRVGSRYAGWYNEKYQRVGHLFQDRFRSENVESTQYFLTVLRYILQNPMKAGIENRLGGYRWSSYLAYAKGKGSLTDTERALSLFDSRDQLLDFLRQGNDDSVMDDSEANYRIRDDRAKEIMKQITHCNSVPDFQRLDPSVQEQYLQELSASRLSISQISRLTGIPRSTAHRKIQMLHPSVMMNETPVFHEEETVFELIPDPEPW